jgi:hypothetical protein
METNAIEIAEQHAFDRRAAQFLADVVRAGSA